MNAREAVVLFGLAQNYFPTLHGNEYTPDAWADILDDITFDDARAALIALCKREKPFTSVGEIRTEARKMRRQRIDQAGELTPPDHLTDEEQRRWLGDTRRAIGDGKPPPQNEIESLPRRDMPQLESVFPRVPDA